MVVPASTLDMVALKRKAAYLKQHVIITTFAIDLPPTLRPEQWIKELESLINARVALYRDVDGGFFFLKLDSVELVRQVLDLTPYHLKVGKTIFQRWILGFNPSQLSGLGVLCWINLKNLPLEFHQHEAKNLATAVGTVLEEDKSG